MNQPTGTITFLFTDIEGSTKLWEAHPDAMHIVLARHDALLRAAIETNGGTVFKTMGDAFCAAFSTATEALEAALSAQQSLHQVKAGVGSNLLKVRMALHTGAAERRNKDYFGKPLNRVARLLAAGHGGQILLSQTTFDLVRDRLPKHATLNDMGEHRLKDLQRPEQVFQLVHPDLPTDFPPLRSLDNPELPNNLPLQLTSFIGRVKEMEAIKKLLTATRLLTLTGSGGCGKTRLSLQVAADILEDYPQGVWLVELAPLADPGLIPQTVAQAVGVREAPGEPITKTLINALKDRQMLLVLDNCEHVLESSARFVDAILHGCPTVKVLVSSREALGISGETSYRVPSLSLPEPDNTYTLQSLSQYEAVRLFVERAEAAKSDFSVTDQNASALASACLRLDGIPLAIELAAARVRALPVEEINSRLDQRFRLLTGGSRTALPRQQTLRAMIDWSYDLLNEKEKVLLHRLSVFAGGWTLEAAEAVCPDAESGKREEGREGTRVPTAGTEGQEGLAPGKSGGRSASGVLFPLPSSLFLSDVFDLLLSLVDKSLVVSEDREGTARYRLLETVRQYARDRLVESAESEVVRERHLDYFLSLAEEAEPKLEGPEQAEWLDVLEAEHENLRAALDWSLGGGEESGQSQHQTPTGIACSSAPNTQHRAFAALRLCAAIWRFWETRGHLSEGRQWCARALEKAGAQERTRERARALSAAGNLACIQGDYASARADHEDSLAIRREIGDRIGIAGSLNNLGLVASLRGDYVSARAYYEDSLAIQRQFGNRSGIATSLMNLGNVAQNQGDYASARAYNEESLAIYRDIGHRSGIAGSLNNLGNVAQNQGDYASARTHLEESLGIQREIGNRGGIANSLGNLGTVTQNQGDYASARTHLEESLAVFREIGDQRGIAWSLVGLGSVAYCQVDFANVRTHLEESLAVFREIGDRRGIAQSLEAFASLAFKEGAPQQAAAWWGAAEALRAEIGSLLPPNERVRYDRDVAEACLALGEGVFSEAWAKGRSMTMEAAIALALEETSS